MQTLEDKISAETIKLKGKTGWNIDVVKKIKEYTGLEEKSIKEFLSRYSNSAFHLFRERPKQLKLELYRISVTLYHGLDMPSSNPIVTELKSQYPEFRYPPGNAPQYSKKHLIANRKRAIHLKDSKNQIAVTQQKIKYLRTL